MAEGLFGHGDDEDDGAPDVDVSEDAALEAVLREEKAELAAKDESLKAMTGDAEGGVDEVPPVPPQRYQRPRPLTDVKQPSPAEVATHNLTHLPYRRWCKWCVMARGPNLPHRS